MPKLSEKDQARISAAQKVYEENLRSQLEPQFIGQIIAVEPESGEFVLGKKFQDVSAACRARFGKKWTFMFRVGGGGAVSIGSGKRYGRIPGRA